MTSRHRGGGHKQQYRVVDFRGTRTASRPRSPPSSTTRTATRASRCCTTSTARSATSSPRPASQVGDMLQSGQGSEIRARQRAAAALHPGRDRGAQRRAQAGRRRRSSAAAPARRSSSWPRKACSPRCACPPPRCGASRSTAGPRSARSATPRPALISIGKAGRNRWKGKRPHVRGVAMNPVDHPLGGGEGKSSGGRHPVSPWGKPEGRTRKKGKASDQLIVRRRRSRGSRR